MFKVENGILFLTRGDDATVPVTLRIRGEPYEMQDGDVLRMTVKRFGAEQPAFFVESESTELSIGHALTEGLDFGKYDADIELRTWDDKVYTVFPKKDTLSDKQLLGLKPLENFWLCAEVTEA